MARTAALLRPHSPPSARMGRLMRLQQMTTDRSGSEKKKQTESFGTKGRNANQTNRDDGSNLASVYRSNDNTLGRDTDAQQLHNYFSV